MLRRSVAATAFATLLAATVVPTANAEDAKMMPRVISLSGHGEVRIVPDMASVNAGVMSQAATAGEALTANTAAMNAIFAALKEAGIEAKDIQTSNFMVQPRYDYNNNNGQAPRLVGYDVSNTVSVTVRKLDQLGTLLDTLVKAGSNQINGVFFQVSEPEAALDEARKRAAADATRKANLYAATMGLTLGPVVSISEGGGY
uniref:SIMPL domain-containing protein n=1 Tax=Aestuariivirga sp. TaxID=2650926 RepID=UPI003593DF63